MDNDALHSTLLSLMLLSDQIHSTRAEVAKVNGNMPEVLRSLLMGLERDLDIAKATLAMEVGLPLCQCCWPPQVIMISKGKPGPCLVRANKALRRTPVLAKRNSNSEFVERQKERLLHLRDLLLDSISGAGGAPLRVRVNAGESACFGGDVADSGRDTSEYDLALTLLSQESEAIAEIEQALDRIERKVYGVCEASGKRIPRARLEAVPFTRYTVECQAEIERRRSHRSLTRARPLFDELPEKAEREVEHPTFI